MVKGSQRFADSGGCGYAGFEYDPASDSFMADQPPQANDAKGGFACHSAAAKRDYAFTEYPSGEERPLVSTASVIGECPIR
jgi:hypothetical protein